jgi:hypothetical protein
MVGASVKIADLDIETRKLLFCARLTMIDPSEDHLKRLKDAFAKWDQKHQQEREQNVIKALWGPHGIMREKLCPKCGQPVLPVGEVKMENEYDHASGCPDQGKTEEDY